LTRKLDVLSGAMTTTEGRRPGIRARITQKGLDYGWL